MPTLINNEQLKSMKYDDPKQKGVVMKRPSRLTSSLILSAVLVLTSFLTRKATASAWEAVADEPPPPEELHHVARLRNVATWAILSGAAVELARVVVRRLIARSDAVTERIGKPGDEISPFV